MKIFFVAFIAFSLTSFGQTVVNINDDTVLLKDTNNKYSAKDVRAALKNVKPENRNVSLIKLIANPEKYQPLRDILFAAAKKHLYLHINVCGYRQVMLRKRTR